MKRNTVAGYGTCMYIQEADSWTVDIPENILILRKYAPKKGKVKGLIPSDIYTFTLQHVCVCAYWNVCMYTCGDPARKIKSNH